MSHITVKEPASNEVAIANNPLSLEALARAAERIGMRLNRGQQAARFYAGRTTPCTHAIVVPNASSEYDRYEIGLVASKTVKDSFAFAYDSFGGGIEKRAGKGCEDLLMFYQMEQAKQVAMANGDIWTERQLQDGTWVGEADTTVRLGV